MALVSLLTSCGACVSNKKLSQGLGKGRYNLWTVVQRKKLVCLWTCMVKEVTLIVVTLVAFHCADFEQCWCYEGHPAIKFCFNHKNMTALSKFFVLRGVKFPANSRVVKFKCGQTRSSIDETPHQKKFRIGSLNVGTLRGRSSGWTSVVFRKSDGMVHLHV